MLCYTPIPVTPSSTSVRECPGAPRASRVRLGGKRSAFSVVPRELFPQEECECPGAPCASRKRPSLQQSSDSQSSDRENPPVRRKLNL